jgi:hypothetical protein
VAASKRKKAPPEQLIVSIGTDLPGPSSFHRMDECIVSEAYPHARSSSRFAMRGHIIHSFLADVQMHGRAEALAKVHPDHQGAMEVMDLSALPAFNPRAYAPEVSFAWNLETGVVREVGRNLSRDESRKRAIPGEVVGSADVVGLMPDSVVIYDYKTGWGFVERAEVNWQLRSYGWLGARRYERERVKYGVIRVRDSGQPWFDHAEMDFLDLELHEERMLDLFERRRKVITLGQRARSNATGWLWQADLPQPHEGEWCRYCPALESCPAKVTAIKRVLNAPPDQPLSATNAVEMFKRIKLAEQILERWKAALKNITRREGPFKVPGSDQVLGLHKVIKDSIVAERLRDPLVEFTGSEMVADAILGDALKETQVVTKKDFRAALQAHYLPLLPPERQKINALEEQAENFLRSKGAMAPGWTEEHFKIQRPGKTVEVPDPQLVEGAGEDLPV